MTGFVRFDPEAEQGELIGSESSGDDGKQRWTELRVWYLHNPESAQKGRCWVAEARGCSNVPGEHTRIRQLRSGSLERALNLFDETDIDIGVIAREQALEWRDESRALISADFEALPLSNRSNLSSVFALIEHKESLTPFTPGKTITDLRREAGLPYYDASEQVQEWVEIVVKSYPDVHIGLGGGLMTAAWSKPHNEDGIELKRRVEQLRCQKVPVLASGDQIECEASPKTEAQMLSKMSIIATWFNRFFR